MSRRIPCPEGYCIAIECGRPLRADTWCPFCDSHWQLVPLDIKRLMLKHHQSSAGSATGAGKRQSIEYRNALQLALDHIAALAKGFTGLLSQTIKDRDLSTT